MKSRFLSLALPSIIAVAGVLLGGCAGGPAWSGSMASGSFSETSSSRNESSGVTGGLRFGDDAISNNAIDGLLSAPESAASSRPKKARDSRPGLATQAGGETWSEVNDISFYRKSTGQPDAIDSFHYNDEAGAKAMADALGGGRKKGGSFSAASDRLEVALQSGGWTNPYDRYEASGRRIVIGRSGSPYQIVLRNRTNHAIEVVASVDGLDVVDGKAASIQKRGYILAAKSELSIDGFRKDRRTVKRFVFGSVDSSEAARAGQARNVGVIGLAVYDEDEAQARAARLAEAQKRAGATAFPTATR